MFALTPGDLLGKILDCAAGPSSFDAELIAEGHEVTSCDSIYSLTAEEIHARILATRDRMVANVRAAREEFVWQEFISPQHLGEVRIAAMQRSLTDFPEGLIQANLQVGEGVDKRLDDALYLLGSSCSSVKSGSWRGKSEAKSSSTNSSLRYS
jgi:hypothetical protein